MFCAYRLGVSTNSGTTKAYISKSSISNKINFFSPGDEKRLAYFKGQITASSEYLVSSDDMVTYYGTQGGMAPPRLILTKSYQALPKKDYTDYSYMDFGDNDCILVWSTNGFSTIEEWGETTESFDGGLENKEPVNINSRIADVYRTTNKGKGKYVAYLPIGNTDGTSYFFETCNLNNRNDLENIIKSIKFMPDLNY